MARTTRRPSSRLEPPVDADDSRHRPPAGANLVADARQLFGPRLVAVIATGTWVSELPIAEAAWPPLGDEAEARLRSALGIAELLLEVEALDTVQAWFVGRNPMLGDRAPAIVVAEDPEKVRRAARDLVAHG